MVTAVFVIGGIIAVLGVAALVYLLKHRPQPPANVIYAASLEYADVAAACAQLQTGYQLRLPAGEARWSQALDVDIPANCSILGAGDLNVRGGGDLTIIYDDCPDNESLMKFGLGEGTFELAGFSIRGGSGQLKNNRVIQLGGSCKALSVHHISVDNSVYTASSERKGGAIRVTGWQNGVIWECKVKAYQAVDVWMPTHSGQKWGDGSWAAPAGLGGSDFVFIEDCEFTSTGGSICDNMPGGRIVCRYSVANHLNTHGTGAASRNRGIRAVEFYNNRIVNTTGSVKDNAVMITGGTGVVWGNVCEGQYKIFCTLKIHRNNNDTYNQGAQPNGWGYAGSAFNGTGSTWDGNEDPTSGYPALDQPGRGQGDLLSVDNFPDAVNTVTGEASYPDQQLEPIYIWGNTWSKVPNNDSSKLVSAAAKYFTEGREYVLAPMPNYAPYPYPHPLRG